MKTLFLQGFGISIKVVDGKVRITNGKSILAKNKEREIIEVATTPNFDKIVIEGTSGWVSMDALKMLSDYGVNVIMVDKKGRLYANFSQIGRSAEPLLRQKQYDCFNDNDRLEHLRKWVVTQKIESQLQLFRELSINNNDSSTLRKAVLNMERHYATLNRAHSLSDIIHVESYVAMSYYPTFAKLFNPKLGFRNRGGKLRTEKDALDVINALLNYGFSILQAEVAKQLNGLGLDCQVGFYHRNHKTNMALVYDMMEPFRYLVDRAVFEIKESMTEKDYHYRRFENKYPYSALNLSSRWLYVSRDLKKRYVNLLTSVFERKRLYKPRQGITSEGGKVQMEELTLMKIKCVELRDYILGTRKSLIEPLKIIAR